MKRRDFLLSVGAVGMTGILPQPARACPEFAINCELVPAPNHQTYGTLNQALRYWVWVCHPDFHQLLQPRWFSYVPVTSNGYMSAVNRVLRNPRQPLQDEVEVHGQQCRQQWFHPGWRMLTVTNCRFNDRRKWVFLLSRSLGATDHGRALNEGDWQQLPHVFTM